MVFFLEGQELAKLLKRFFFELLSLTQEHLTCLLLPLQFKQQISHFPLAQVQLQLSVFKARFESQRFKLQELVLLLLILELGPGVCQLIVQLGEPD